MLCLEWILVGVQRTSQKIDWGRVSIERIMGFRIQQNLMKHGICDALKPRNLDVRPTIEEVHLNGLLRSLFQKPEH